MTSRPSPLDKRRRAVGLMVGRRRRLARNQRGARHLFDRWREVSAWVRSAERIALFLDFDGTLAPLRRYPGEVRLEARARRAVARLARDPGIMVCVISGRRLADLRRRVAVRGVLYLGLHGWERKGGQSMGAALEPLARAKPALAQSLGKLEGVWVEDKSFSLAVHYRSASESMAERARTALRGALKPFAGKLRILHGKKMWEVLPVDIVGKGAAVREILTARGDTALPVYVGDDTTDESAFEALHRGITVYVGPARRTRARFRLRDPQEVCRFLERLEAEIH